MAPKHYDSLFKEARKAFNYSHSPYSQCKVAAAVLMKDGLIFNGCNVENASYGATICAERVAICKAVSEGSKEIVAILVLTDNSPPWAPCGICRQTMVEFGSTETIVYLANLDGEFKSSQLEELCPSFFSPDDLTT